MAKFDLDLAREMLVRLENLPYGSHISEFQFRPELAMLEQHHVHCLAEAGLVADLKGMVRLTWRGTEFLAMARDERHWQRARAWLAEVDVPETLRTMETALQVTRGGGQRPPRWPIEPPPPPPPPTRP